VVYKDAGSPLQLRVSAGGSKTFYVVVGQGRRHTIGRFGEVTLAQARDVARRIKAEKTLGKYQRHSITWEAARDKYLARSKEQTRPKTYREYERILMLYFPFSGNLHDITKHEVAQRLTRITAPSQRDHALVCLRIFFRWAISHGYLDADPTEGLKKEKSTTRARLLSDIEVKLIWQATDEPSHYNTIVRLLILTGQRRNEIASLKAEYIKDDICTIPGTLTKNGREHTFPIGKHASSIIENSSDKHGLMFPARGKQSPFAGWSKAKAALDRRLGGTVEPWTLHDCRRFYASTMARLGVRQEVTERLLNHRSGIISGIAAVYTLHDFMPEMRAAVDLYQNHLERILKD
jgi:integrase